MLEILDADEEFLIGVRGHVVTVIWGRMTVERMQRVLTAHEPVTARLSSKGFAAMNLVIPRRSNELPGVDALRTKLRQMNEPHVLASAVVIEGEGILAGVTRTAANAMQAVRTSKYPQKICSSVDEATRWLMPLCAPRTGDTFSTSDLAWDVNAARAHIATLVRHR